MILEIVLFYLLPLYLIKKIYKFIIKIISKKEKKLLKF